MKEETIQDKIVKSLGVANLIFGVICALISLALNKAIVGVLGLYPFILGLFLMVGTKLLKVIGDKK